jgi:low affinity Fe/Cu permease
MARSRDEERPVKGHGQNGSFRHCLNTALERFSRQVTAWAGSSWAFAVACAVVVVWALLGPVFQYSETWQLVINTGTTIVTFLMVFLVQRAQNKESLALHMKLNELLASQQGASNELINLEDKSEETIAELHERFTALAGRLRQYAKDGDQHSVTEVAREASELAEAARQHHARRQDRARAKRPAQG